ncbi:MAG: hypothetical protein AB7T19_13485 [Planctomycetota bacterium]
MPVSNDLAEFGSSPGRTGKTRMLGWVVLSSSVALLAFTALLWRRSITYDELEPRVAALVARTRSEPGESTTKSPRIERISSRDAVVAESELRTVDAEPAPADCCDVREADQETSHSVAAGPELSAAATADPRAARNAYLAEVLDVVRTECTEAEFVDALNAAQDRAPISPLGGLSAREMSETYFVTTLVLGEQFITYCSEHNANEGTKASMRRRLAGDPARLLRETRQFNSAVAARSGFFAILPDFARHIADGTIRIRIDQPDIGHSPDGWDPRRIGVTTAGSFRDHPQDHYVSFWWQSGPWRISARVPDSIWPESVLHAIRNPRDR